MTTASTGCKRSSALADIAAKNLAGVALPRDAVLVERGLRPRAADAAVERVIAATSSVHRFGVVELDPHASPPPRRHGPRTTVTPELAARRGAVKLGRRGRHAGAGDRPSGAGPRSSAYLGAGHDQHRGGAVLAREADPRRRGLGQVDHPSPRRTARGR